VEIAGAASRRSPSPPYGPALTKGVVSPASALPNARDPAKASQAGPDRAGVAELLHRLAGVLTELLVGHGRTSPGAEPMIR